MPQCKGEKDDGSPCSSTIVLANGYCRGHQKQAIGIRAAAGQTQTAVVDFGPGDAPPVAPDVPRVCVGCDKEAALDDWPLCERCAKNMAAVEKAAAPSGGLQPRREPSEPRPKRKAPRRGKKGYPRWKRNQKFPKYYDRRCYPCHSCRLTRLPSGSPAVKVLSSASGFVFLECRKCNHKMDVLKEEPGDNPAYAFPTKSKCPRCNEIKTEARGKNRDGSKQYRVCLRCDWHYSVDGNLV